MKKVSYRMTLEYDGGRFQGWQRQSEKQSASGVRTVSGMIEKALRDAGYHVMTLMGSGRTDAGVHAMAQVAHLHLGIEPNQKPIKIHELMKALDQNLPSDIAVQNLEACPVEFHARHDAVQRSYLYQLSLRRSAFGKPYLWWVKGRLDQDLLSNAWKQFEGKHDMMAFADLEKGEDSRVQIRSCQMEQRGSLLLLRTSARFFLRRQVRRMVGAAVQVALGKVSLERLQSDLQKPTREGNLFWSELAAPAAGLFLECVDYQTPHAARPLESLIRIP